MMKDCCANTSRSLQQRIQTLEKQLKDARTAKHDTSTRFNMLIVLFDKTLASVLEKAPSKITDEWRQAQWGELQNILNMEIPTDGDKKGSIGGL
jgi:hypothetical protein